MAVAALFCGAIIWIWALRRCVRFSQRPWAEFEYWWAYAAFFAGGLGTLATFGFLELATEQVTAVRVGPLALLGTLLVIRSIVRGAKISASGFYLGALFLLFGAFAITGQGFLMPLASLFILLPCIITPTGGYSFLALRNGIIDASVLLLTVLILLAVLIPNQLIGPCRFDKCSLWGESLGAVGTGNALGLMLAILGPITVAFSARLVPTLGILIGSYVLVDLTSSRSAIVAWGVGAVLVLAFFVSRRMSALWPIGAATSVVAAAAVAIPLVSWSEGSFTGRSELWARSVELFYGSPWFGYGASFWVGQHATNDLFANYATHNLFSEMLVSGGAVGALLLILAVLFALNGTPGTPISTVALLVAGVWIASSLTEVVAAPGRVYLFPGALVFVFLIAHSTSSVHREENPEPNGGSRRISRSRGHRPHAPPNEEHDWQLGASSLSAMKSHRAVPISISRHQSPTTKHKSQKGLRNWHLSP